MIVVTRLNKQEVALNCDLIEMVEALPDTTIRLLTGKILVVREPLDVVLAKIRAWRSSVVSGAGLEGLLTNAPAKAVLLPLEPREDEDDDEERALYTPVALDRFLEIPA